MGDVWQLRVYDKRDLVYTADLSGPTELGRQSDLNEKLYTPRRDRPGLARVAIASKDENEVSRRHALLEPLPEGGFRLTNLSGKSPIRLPDGLDLQPQATCVLPTDVLLTLGTRAVRLRKSGEGRLHGLAEATIPPGRGSILALPFAPRSRIATASMDARELLTWLHAAMDVLQSAASSADFFDKAARAVVDLVNLDSGRVLLLKNDEWLTQALQSNLPACQAEERPPSRHVLTQVREEKRTFWDVPQGPALAASLTDIETVVAAPILDRKGEVIGALYGDRRLAISSNPAEPITEVEAMLVEVLARGIAAGLARLEQEQAALAARVQFEQFFTPELSRQLALHPDLLGGRDAEVTLLFCDIRGFSRVSERLEPARTVAWIGDVMEALSDCVRTHQGVLVDYIGDELLAMWGAPEEQPDHAQLACQAALAMLEQLPRLNERWLAEVGEPINLGIGINTGVAHVGNTGSRHKFKYGPLGNTVNLASRVQGATKHLKCKLLITGGTHARLDDRFSRRRLCKVRVVNIAEPVELYELAPLDRPNWASAKTEYEKALDLFEREEFGQAARILGNYGPLHNDDAPALVLLYRAVHHMVEESASFDPVWVLPSK